MRSQLEEERTAREVVEASAAQLGADLAEMSSEAQRLQVGFRKLGMSVS